MKVSESHKSYVIKNKTRFGLRVNEPCFVTDGGVLHASGFANYSLILRVSLVSQGTTQGITWYLVTLAWNVHYSKLSDIVFNDGG